MPSVLTPVEKTKTYTPVVKTCRVRADRGTFFTQTMWKKINDMSELWPESRARHAAIYAAKKWIADMEKQGFTLLTAESDVLVAGPISHLDWSKFASRSWQPGEGMSKTVHAGGRIVGAPEDTDYEDFLLRAQFLSTKTRRVEYLAKGDA